MVVMDILGNAKMRAKDFSNLKNLSGLVWLCSVWRGGKMVALNLSYWFGFV